MNDIRVGTIEKWLGTYGYIFETHARRYFFHLHQFDSARLPIVGETVEFELGPEPPAPGRLPVARRVVPSRPHSGVQALTATADTSSEEAVQS